MSFLLKMSEDQDPFDLQKQTLDHTSITSRESTTECTLKMGISCYRIKVKEWVEDKYLCDFFPWIRR